ncbi:MAG: hypothetical protein ABII25_03430, partial [bacterium]
EGIYVVSSLFNSIQVFGEDGQFKEVASDEWRVASFNPHHIFLDNWDRVINSDGTVVEVVDLNNGSKKKITDWWDDNIHPADIGIDGEGRIYVLDSVTNSVKIYGAGGNSLKKEINLVTGFLAGHHESPSITISENCKNFYKEENAMI